MDTTSGTLVNGHISGDFQGFADATDTLFGKGFAAPDLTFSESGLSQSFSKNGSKSGFSPNGSTYSLSVFGNFTLNGGSNVTLTGGNVQTVATPVPSSGVLILSGLPLLGLGFWLRRRTTRKVPMAA